MGTGKKVMSVPEPMEQSNDVCECIQCGILECVLYDEKSIPFEETSAMISCDLKSGK